MTASRVTQCAHQEIAGVIDVRRNQPMVSSLKIAQLFERPHKNVLASIRKELAEEISRLEIKPRHYTDPRGKAQPMFWLNEEQALFPDRKVALARLVMRRRTNQLRIAA